MQISYHSFLPPCLCDIKDEEEAEQSLVGDHPVQADQICNLSDSLHNSLQNSLYNSERACGVYSIRIVSYLTEQADRPICNIKGRTIF